MKSLGVPRDIISINGDQKYICISLFTIRVHKCVNNSEANINYDAACKFIQAVLMPHILQFDMFGSVLWCQ